MPADRNAALARMRAAPACADHIYAVAHPECDACLDAVRRAALPEEPSDAALLHASALWPTSTGSTAALAAVLRAAYRAEREGR